MKTYSYNCLNLLLLVMFVGCTSVQKNEPPQKTNLQNSLRKELPLDNAKVEEVIDYNLLEQAVNLKIPTEKLGYYQKSFNTCRVGSGYPSNTNCRNLNYVVIHFRVRCRDTEGTTSEIVTEANLRDNANKDMIWTLQNKTGEIVTNGEGYGEIREVYQGSPKIERLRVSDGKRFLYLKANELTTAIVPNNWCD